MGHMSPFSLLANAIFHQYFKDFPKMDDPYRELPSYIYPFSAPQINQKSTLFPPRVSVHVSFRGGVVLVKQVTWHLGNGNGFGKQSAS
jgi:hypothetical protein